jgi:hypothetical protein
VQVHRERERIEAAGAALVLVGNGNAGFARAFREDFGITAPLYVDPSRRTYRALGLARPGFLSLLSPRLVAAVARALRAGFMQGAVRGDPYQLGGVVVVAKGGRVVFRHVARDAGDHAAVGEVVHAAGRAAAA